MGVPKTETIEKFYLSRDGHQITFGRSESEVRAHIKNGKSGYEITSSQHEIARVDGTVYDWSKRGGHSINFKLHWNCPKCGGQWFEDFVGDVENPMFATGNLCRCFGYWWVNRDSAQVERERKLNPTH